MTDLLEARRNSIHKQLGYILAVSYELEDCPSAFESRSAYSYLGQLSRENKIPTPKDPTSLAHILSNAIQFSNLFLAL